MSGLDPRAGGQLTDDRRVDGRVGLKGELLQPLWSGKPGVADAPLGAPTSAVVAFGDYQFRQKTEIGHLLTLSCCGDLGEPVPDGWPAQHATPLLDRCGRGLHGDVAPPCHEVSRPSRVSYLSTEGSGRSSAGMAAQRCAARLTT